MILSGSVYLQRLELIHKFLMEEMEEGTAHSLMLIQPHTIFTHTGMRYVLVQPPYHHFSSK